jgi:CubicO group peptidase (beta-lactamase class C family)
LIVAALPTAALAQTKKPTSPDWAAFDRYVAQAAKDWHVPGLAIAVVKDDSLVFAKGYGVIEMVRPARADEHTRFAIGSTTKAMTSASLAMLVDEGKLRGTTVSSRTSRSFNSTIPATRDLTAICSRTGADWEARI